MVRLDRIYTRDGDDGLTSLADGTRVAKHALRIAAQGEIDEANCAIGLARLHLADATLGPMLARAQNDLFDLGADITVPGDDPADGALRIVAAQTARLEREIDRLNEALAPLSSFILPAGGAAATHLHFARAVVRRAERAASALAAAEKVNREAFRYLNRLSDLLFVMARAANGAGAGDVLWRKGLTRDL
ncbi:MAG: cob(I)yrinic acid a,c-diamide adenosyltransferase [Alphaproteobacteria bacterium]|nr:cob(I)yrinic acid a,c-diamide adenosyltransferase [Alphaproteobacteria bacterium]